MSGDARVLVRCEATYQLVDEEPEQILLLLGLRAKEGSEERECLRADVRERVERECLEDLKHGEEVLLEPVLEVPDEEVRICPVGVQQRLVTEVPVRDVSDTRDGTSWRSTYLSFRPGPPPPTHQSTTHRTAFKPSSLPPLARPRCAILRRLSRASVLCTGLACTSRVSALSRSESVPVERMVLRKCASDVLCVEEEEE